MNAQIKCNRGHQQRSADLDILKCDDTAKRANLVSACTSSSLAGGLSGCMVGQRCSRGRHAGGLRDSSVAGLCRTCGAAPAGGHLRLFAGWARLRPALLLAPTPDRTDLLDFLDDRWYPFD